MKKLSRIVPILVGLFAALHAASIRAENIEEGPVYVVDQGVSLEQAIGQALVENQLLHQQRFWIVISGRAAALATNKGATPTQQNLIKQVRERGGLIYVCRADLAALEIEPSELLSVIRAVRGFGAAQEDAPFPAQSGEILLP